MSDWTTPVADSGSICGYVREDFAAVRDIVAAQLTAGEHHGFGLVAHLHGEVTVDLWGGVRRCGSGSEPWTPTTLACGFSAAKVLPTLALHHATFVAGVDLSTPLRLFWPEFQDDRVTISHVLNHEAGLPHIRAITTDIAAVDDHEFMSEALASLPPLWDPGTRCGYHALTFGALAAESVRRLTGKDPAAAVGELLALASPVDAYLRVPAEAVERVAPTVVTKDPVVGVEKLAAGRSAVWQSFLPFDELRTYVNSEAGRTAMSTSFGGYFSARGLAQIYQFALDEAAGTGAGYLEPRAVRRFAVQDRKPRPDQVLMMARASWRDGFLGGAGSRLLPQSAFGMHGFGGSFGLADPVTGLAVALICDQAGSLGHGARRSEQLASAIFGCL